MILKARQRNHATKGTYIEAHLVGGERKRLRPPVKPFFYSTKLWKGAPVVSKYRLSDLQKVTLWRPEFDNDNERRRRANTEGVLEGQVNYIRRLTAIVGFRHDSSKLPSLLSWDLESRADGVKPDPATDILRSVATWNDEGTREFKSGSEPVVAEWFIDLVKDVDPDVLMDYNGSFYDVPLLMNACKRFDIKCALGRDGSEPYIRTWESRRGTRVFRNSRVYLDGRVHFDAYKEAFADYGLVDLKNRRLNTVAKHFGLKPIEGVSHANISEEQLEEINLDDARVTYGVSQVYLPVLYELCDMLGVPLEMMATRTSSFIGHFIYMQEFDKLGVVSDGINADRFPWAFDSGGRVYEGANVQCFETGLFKPVNHSDYASFYASIMVAGNFSPETCFLMSVKPYTGRYRFGKLSDDWAVYEVPDKYRGQVTVKVYLGEDSIGRRRIVEFLDRRSVAKANWKATKDPKYTSQSIALKLCGNAMYGYNGMRYSLYGNILVAILTTAMARFIIDGTMEEYRAKGYRIIEVDTDGFWWV